MSEIKGRVRGTCNKCGCYFFDVPLPDYAAWVCVPDMRASAITTTTTHAVLPSLPACQPINQANTNHTLLLTPAYTTQADYQQNNTKMWRVRNCLVGQMRSLACVDAPQVTTLSLAR